MNYDVIKIELGEGRCNVERGIKGREMNRALIQKWD